MILGEEFPLKIVCSITHLALSNNYNVILTTDCVVLLPRQV